MIIEALQPEGHTLKELAWRLSAVRRKRVPDRTLRWWIDELHIQANAFGLYSDSDLQVLIALVLFLKRCRSLAKFRELLLKEIESHEYRHQQVEAIR